MWRQGYCHPARTLRPIAGLHPATAHVARALHARAGPAAPRYSRETNPVRASLTFQPHPRPCHMQRVRGDVPWYDHNRCESSTAHAPGGHRMRLTLPTAPDPTHLVIAIIQRQDLEPLVAALRARDY